MVPTTIKGFPHRPEATSSPPQQQQSKTAKTHLGLSKHMLDRSRVTMLESDEEPLFDTELPADNLKQVANETDSIQSNVSDKEQTHLRRCVRTYSPT